MKNNSDNFLRDHASPGWGCAVWFVVIMLVVSMFLGMSCSGSWLSRMYDREAITYLNNGRYYKNADTGLCFLVANSYRSMTAVCVPCSVLEGERVIVYHPQKWKK